MDLVFSPATPSSSNGEGNASDTLWLDPLIRWTTATLLDTYARHMPTDRYHLPECSLATLKPQCHLVLVFIQHV